LLSFDSLQLSSIGKAEFIGDDPVVKPLCLLFCVSSTQLFVLHLMTFYMILPITGNTVIPL
jgi:hypothetical protein